MKRFLCVASALLLSAAAAHADPPVAGASTDDKINKIIKVLDGIDKRLDGLDQRVSAIDSRLSSLETKYASPGATPTVSPRSAYAPSPLASPSSSYSSYYGGSASSASYSPRSPYTNASVRTTRPPESRPYSTGASANEYPDVIYVPGENRYSTYVGTARLYASSPYSSWSYGSPDGK